MFNRFLIVLLVLSPFWISAAPIINSNLIQQSASPREYNGVRVTKRTIPDEEPSAVSSSETSRNEFMRDLQKFFKEVLTEDGEYEEYVPKPYDQVAAKETEQDKIERSQWAEIPGSDVVPATPDHEAVKEIDVSNPKDVSDVEEKAERVVPAQEQPRHHANAEPPARELNFEDLMAAVDNIFDQVQKNEEDFKLPPRPKEPEPQAQPALSRDRIGSADELHSIKGKGQQLKKQALHNVNSLPESASVLESVSRSDDEVSIADHVPYSEAQLQALEIESLKSARTSAQKRRLNQIWKDWKQQLKNKAREIKLKFREPKFRPQPERSILMHPFTFHV